MSELYTCPIGAFELVIVPFTSADAPALIGLGKVLASYEPNQEGAALVPGKKKLEAATPADHSAHCNCQLHHSHLVSENPGAPRPA